MHAPAICIYSGADSSIYSNYFTHHFLHVKKRVGMRLTLYTHI
jgi:uncharacterized membrane protein YoaT (DUF817 family)